jgi:predicted amidohydrolase YtcJ
VDANGPADLIFSGGGVYTLEPDRPWAEAVAVRGDTIVFVGTDDGSRGFVGPRTRVIDIRGRMLLPGFQDAHVHAPSGGLDRIRCDLSGETTVEGYTERIRAYAASVDDGWVVGAGWSMSLIPGGFPYRETLDDVVPDCPAFIADANNHAAWVNSRALAIAGIDRGTPDPLDGRIARDPLGVPLGVLLEGAMDLVRRHVPPTPYETRLAGLLAAQTYLHSLGITAWQDAIVGAYSTIEDSFDCYLEAARSSALTARVVGALWFRRGVGVDEQLGFLTERRRAATSAGRFRADTVKIMIDGGCENHSASMTEPYLSVDGSPADNVGVSFFEPEELRDAVVTLDRAGFGLHVHAIGDRACRDALDAFSALDPGARADRRHHMAHVHVIDPDDVTRLGSLGIVANMQPLWAAHGPEMDVSTIPFLGEPRASWQYPIRGLVEAGARLAFGSDWPVTSCNPLWGIHVAVNRQLPEALRSHLGVEPAEPLIPEQRIDLATAIRAYTMGSAFVNRVESETGSIRTGKRADLVVLDRNVFEAPAERIGDARVEMTVIDGVPVFESADST